MAHIEGKAKEDVRIDGVFYKKGMTVRSQTQFGIENYLENIKEIDAPIVEDTPIVENVEIESSLFEDENISEEVK